MSRIRIFIAEDSATVRVTLKHALSDERQFEIIGEAADGKTALAQIKNTKPDVAVIDIGLPGLDGIEVTKELKLSINGVRVIICTSSFEERAIFSAFAAGADGYILKGRTPDSLARAVHSVSDGVGWLDPAIASTVLRASSSAAATLLAKSMSAQKKQSPPGVDPVSAQLQKAELRGKAFMTSAEAHSPVSVLLLLGATYEMQKDDVRTEALYHGALALAEKLHGSQDIDVAIIASKLADFYYERDKYAKAEPLYLKALEIRHAALGESHEAVARSLEDLANLYDTEGEYANAERYYVWALSIRENLGSPQLTAETCSKIAWIYRAQGKTELAEQLDQRARQLAK